MNWSEDDYKKEFIYYFLGASKEREIFFCKKEKVEKEEFIYYFWSVLTNFYVMIFIRSIIICHARII